MITQQQIDDFAQVIGATSGASRTRRMPIDVLLVVRGRELEGSEDSYLAVYRSDGTDFVTVRGMLEIAAEVDFTRCDEDVDDD